MNTDTESLILEGNGYSLTISPDAEKRKASMLVLAASVTGVATNDDSADAQHVSRTLGQMRIEVEKCRKMVKEPVNRIGKLIDATAAEFVAGIKAEEERIHRLVGDHAESVAAEQAAALAVERAAFEVAQAARVAAEQAAAAAADSSKLSDTLAAIAAAKARQTALDERMAASASVAELASPNGVRFAIDFEVDDTDKLADTRRDLVTIIPSRMAILTWLRDADEHGRDIVAAGERIGLRVFKKPVVSSR